jgi:hypothetical protein
MARAERKANPKKKRKAKLEEKQLGKSVARGWKERCVRQQRKRVRTDEGLPSSAHTNSMMPDLGLVARQP